MDTFAACCTVDPFKDYVCRLFRRVIYIDEFIDLLIIWQLRSYRFVHMVWIVWITLWSRSWSRRKCKWIYIFRPGFALMLSICWWMLWILEPKTLFSVCLALYFSASYLWLLYVQVIQSWYVMGRLGAFNSSNLQVRILILHHILQIVQRNI